MNLENKSILSRCGRSTCTLESEMIAGMRTEFRGHRMNAIFSEAFPRSGDDKTRMPVE